LINNGFFLKELNEFKVSIYKNTMLVIIFFLKPNTFGFIFPK